MEDFRIEHRYDSCGFRLSCHYENTYQVLFVLAGRILYKVGGKEYEVSRGGMIVLNTRENHTLKVLEYPYERYLIQIRSDFFLQEVQYPEIIAVFVKRPPDFSHLLIMPEPVWSRLYVMIQEMEQEYLRKNKYWEIYVGSSLRRMFILVFRECAEGLSVLKTGSSVTIAYKIMNYLEHHFTEEITVDSIAEAMYLNKNYIAHVFKDETGFSLMNYVISLRINKAKLLLTETGKSITDVASECGYSDFTYFSKQFKKITGSTPSRFRKDMAQQAGMREAPD